MNKDKTLDFTYKGGEYRAELRRSTVEIYEKRVNVLMPNVPSLYLVWEEQDCDLTTKDAERMLPDHLRVWYTEVFAEYTAYCDAWNKASDFN